MAESYEKTGPLAIIRRKESGAQLYEAWLYKTPHVRAECWGIDLTKEMLELEVAITDQISDNDVDYGEALEALKTEGLDVMIFYCRNKISYDISNIVKYDIEEKIKYAFIKNKIQMTDKYRSDNDAIYIIPPNHILGSKFPNKPTHILGIPPDKIERLWNLESKYHGEVTSILFDDDTAKE